MGNRFLVPSATPGQQGGMTLISTTALSGASVTLSSIPQTYKSLYLLIYGVTNATGQNWFACRFNGSSSANYSMNGSGSGAVMNVAGETYLSLSGNQTQPDRTSANNVFSVLVNNYTSSSNWKSYSGFAAFTNTGTKTCVYGGGFSDNTAITSIVLSNLGGNLSAGTVELYGVK